MMVTRDPDAEDLGRADQSEDGEAVNERRRLKAIHEARQAVTEQRRRADEALYRGEIDQFTAQTALRRAIEDYAMEVEALMRAATRGESDRVVERNYWAGYQIASWTLDNGEGREMTIDGLREFLDLPDPIRYTVERTESHPVRGETTETAVAKEQVPRHVLLSVFRTINQFLFDVGLDLDVSDGPEEYEFTYESIEDAAMDLSGWDPDDEADE